MVKLGTIIVIFLSSIVQAGAYGDHSPSNGHGYRDALSTATYDCILREAWETPKAPVPFARLDFSRAIDPYHDLHMLLIEGLSISRFR